MAAARVEAAGGVLWRGDPHRPEVALVHRPRYDDWSLPKGKLERGEHPLLGALREIEEETGATSRPGRRLGSSRYLVVEGPKRVRYWAFEATGGAFIPNREVDRIWWGPVPIALRRVDPTQSGRILGRFAADTRRTRVLALVRHASAGSRARWPGPDAERPLDRAGRARAVVIAALLTAYGVTRTGHADVARCADTLEPFGRDRGVPSRPMPDTNAGTFGHDPVAASRSVLGLLEGGRAGAWCGQQEVLTDLVSALCAELGEPATPAGLGKLGKGGLLLLHLDCSDRLVRAERLPG